jgi:hypothetical protein
MPDSGAAVWEQRGGWSRHAAVGAVVRQWLCSYAMTGSIVESVQIVWHANMVCRL